MSLMNAATAEPSIRTFSKSLHWPGGSHVAVAFGVAYEAWSDGKAPGLSPMGNPLPPGTFDSNALSWGRYGQADGIERLLRILDRTAHKASVMVSGILAERAPAQVKAIAAAGHEVVAHSYAQDVVPATLSPQDDKENIRKTTAILQEVTGTRPTGWISPRGTPGPSTVRELIAAGYRYHSDVLDADMPYVQLFDNGSILAVPFTMDINDLPHAMRFGRTPRQFVENFSDYLEHTMKAVDGPIIIDVTAHCHCYGRPGGAWAYEEIARQMMGRDDVWLTTRGAIADYVLAAGK
jgi:peptidoglycan/xylan/chitin deacetylase (PgdA/CDA1 family)